ncbi:MAG: hypothetical protein ABSE73_24935 [Planctomycetota bacterium]
MTEGNDGHNGAKGRRVTIDLAPGAAQEVDRLRSVTGLTTADLFRYALALVRTYVDAQQRGMEVRLVDPAKPDVVTRLELPVIMPREMQVAK